MKIRIKFSKLGHMKFVGHLDIMRLFQKAFRRAGFDIQYSKGFSPHPLMSFAQPLGIGLTSEGEYLDIEIENVEAKDTMIKRLQDEMPDDMEILDWKELEESAKNAMSLVSKSDYLITFLNDQLAQEAMDRFFEKEQIMVIKKTKSSEKEINIRPLIHEYKLRTNQQLFMGLAAGSVDNLKPELVIQALFEDMGLTYKPFGYQIHRIELYGKNNDEFVPFNNLHCLE